MIRLLNITIVLLLIWFLNDSFLERREPSAPVNEILGTDKTPDYYSENLSIRQYDEQGELQSMIKTKKLSHYLEQQFIELDAPELLLYGLEGSKRAVTASTGTIDTVSHNLSLNDNVLLQISGNSQLQNMLVTTSAIQYTVSEKTLWTNTEVVAKFNDGNFVLLTGNLLN